jgi:propionyl-CoA synthetase
MIPAAVFAMLAVARLGAVHTVVFGGFASKALAQRIESAKPKAIMTASCGIEGTKGALAYKVCHSVNLNQRTPEAEGHPGNLDT